MSDLFADLKIGESATLRIDGHPFLVTATAETGIHTGRRRYAVTCITCSATIHPATTGPEDHAEGHIRDAQRHLACVEEQAST